MTTLIIGKRQQFLKTCFDILVPSVLMESESNDKCNNNYTKTDYSIKYDETRL